MNYRVPDAYPYFDVRYDPKKWLDDLIDGHMRKVFEARFAAERFMTYSQLKAFDHHMLKHFEINRMKRELESEFYKERELFHQCLGRYQMFIETEGSRMAEGMRMDAGERHDEIMGMMRDKDLLYKRFAYDIARWKKMEDTDEIEEVFKNIIIERI